MNDFSVRLREAMNNKGMKQSELANKTKIDKSQIHHYLKGTYEPKNENIQLIADALNVSVTWLLGYDIPFHKEIKHNNLQNDDIELNLIYQSLNEEQKKQLLSFAKYLKQNNK